MPNIKPVSDLSNYNEVLRDCKDGAPVFLTKDGRGKYVLLELQEYERQQALIELLSRLAEAEAAIKSGEEWQSMDELKKLITLK